MVDTAVTLTEEDTRAVVELAVLAPSIHNTQPWRWRYDGAGLRLFADPDRSLPVADPDGRQLLISCGAALAFARLAMRARGLVPVVTLGPLDDTAPPTADIPLATITATERRPTSPAEAELVEAMRARHTDRRPFQPGGLMHADVVVLRHAAEAESCWLLAIDDVDLRVETSVLLARADWQEAHDPAYLSELRRWSRTDENAADGITRNVVVGDADRRRSEFTLRDFDVVGEPGAEPAGAEPAPVERPAVIVIGTDTDRPVDRLIAGGALGRVLLTVTARGAAASPLGQVLDIAATRELLRQATGGIGHVQMLLRLGRPDPDAEPLRGTPRRPVDEVLEIA